MPLSIIIGGDIVPSFQNLDAFCAGDIQNIIDTDCLNVLNAADLRVYNLETPFTDAEDPIKKEGANFRVPEAAIRGLRLLKPDAISLGNNHCKDQGEQGLLRTVQLLQDNGISPFGYGKSHTDEHGTVYLQKNGMTVAVLSCAETEYTIFGDGEYGAIPYHAYWTNAAIAAAKQNSDLVIVLYHGGKEYYRYVAPYHKERCHLMVDCGADYVISQHSHCVSCYEEYKNRTILYGQGNFIFRQRNDRKQTKEGLLVRICVDENGRNIAFLPVMLDENDRVCLAVGETKDRILAELEQQSETIKDSRKLEAEYQKFAKTMAPGYNVRLLGDSRLIRMIARIYNRLGIRLRNQDGRLQLLNLMQNEAHRELFMAYLRGGIVNDKSDNP